MSSTPDLAAQLAHTQIAALIRLSGGDGAIMESFDGEWLTFYVNQRRIGLTELTGDLVDDIDRLFVWTQWMFQSEGQILKGRPD